jgi:hypothetical protein
MSTDARDAHRLLPSTGGVPCEGVSVPGQSCASFGDHSAETATSSLSPNTANSSATEHLSEDLEGLHQKIL